MLDLTNPDASKVILSYIQDKTSGIEKTMVHAVISGDENRNPKIKKGNIVDGVINDVNRVECLKSITTNSLVKFLRPHHPLVSPASPSFSESTFSHLLDSH
ncbi:hypothetical protein RYX36_021531 [Vicia faba]